MLDHVGITAHGRRAVDSEHEPHRRLFCGRGRPLDDDGRKPASPSFSIQPADVPVRATMIAS